MMRALVAVLGGLLVVGVFLVRCEDHRFGLPRDPEDEGQEDVHGDQ